MKHLKLKAFAAALLLALAAPPQRAAAQGGAAEAERLAAEIARLKREVQRVESEIRRADSLAAAEQAAAEKNRERAARDLERRSRENAALEARVKDARARIAAERARGDGHVAAAAELKAREKAVMAFLAVVTDTLRSRIESGMPLDAEGRAGRVTALRHDIEAGTASPEEAFSRLLALVREEIKEGDEVTLSSRPVTRRDGEVVNAQVLRIGNQVAAYMDEDGRRFGILEPRLEDGRLAWSWREDLGLAERNAVKRAVMVKAGREAPQLMPLEVSLAGLRETRGRAKEGGR